MLNKGQEFYPEFYVIISVYWTTKHRSKIK